MAGTTVRSLGPPANEIIALAALCGVALVLHAFGIGVLYVAPWLGGVLFPQDDTPEVLMEVSLVAMPQTDASMSQMDVAPPPPETPVDPEAAPPELDPGLSDQGTSEPTPEVNSDMTVPDPEARDPQGDPSPDTREARERALREARRRALLDAAVGSELSEAGDPDSTSSERIDLGGSGPAADPALARYINQLKQIFLASFNPLPTLAQNNPDLRTIIQVRFDLDTGQVQSWSWDTKSGNPSWDAAAQRAVEAVSRVPLPPERFREQFTNGAHIKFDPDGAR